MSARSETVVPSSEMVRAGAGGRTGGLDAGGKPEVPLDGYVGGTTDPAQAESSEEMSRKEEILYDTTETCPTGPVFSTKV